MNDLISREALKDKAETVTLWNGDIRRFVSYETIDNAPTFAERPQGEFTRKELESWLYRIASNNLNNELGRSCEEIIGRLDGFERFVSDMRKDGADMRGD